MGYRIFYRKSDAVQLEENEIYPNVWGDEDCDYLVEYFEDIKMFYEKADSENKMVIQYIS